MDNEQVLVKIAADVGDAVAAMQAMVAQVGAMIAAMAEVGEQSKKSSDDVEKFHKQNQKSTEDSVASGILLSKAYDLIVESIDGAIKSIPAMIEASAAMGDSFQAMSNRLGVSVSNLSELDFIAKQSGANMQGLARTIQGMSGILSDEFSKSGKLIKSLGLNFQELKAGNPEEAFYAIITAIKETVPAAQQNTVAMEIFGSKFRGNTMLLKEDTDALRKMFKEMGGGVSDELGKLGNKYSSVLGQIELKQQSFKNSIAESVLPTMISFAETMRGLPAPLLIVGNAAVDVGGKFLKFSENMIMSKGWTEYADMMVKSKDKILDYSGTILDAGKGVLDGVKSWATSAHVSWADVGDKMGKAFLSGKEAILQFGENAGKTLSDFGQTLKNSIQVDQIIPNLQKFAGFLQGQLVGAFGMVRTAMTAMMGPWGLLAIAVVALGAALYELVGGWDGIKVALQGAMKFFEDLWVVVKHLAVDGIQALVKWFVDLRAKMASLGEGTGILAMAVKAISAIFEKWVGLIKTLTSWIPGLFKMLGKVVGDAADKYRELDAAKSAVEDPKKPGADLAKPKTAMEELAEAAREVTTAYGKLVGAQGEQVKAYLKQGQTASEVGKALAKDLGGSEEIWTKAVEKFKKDQEDLKKAAEKSPLGKLHKETEDLAQALKDATASGAPMTQMVDSLGKKASEVVEHASRIPGELNKVPQSIKDIGAAWEANDLAKKIDPLNKQIKEMGVAFSRSMEAGAKASIDAATAMEETITSAFMTGSEARIAAIDKEELAKANALQANIDATETARLDEIGKIQDLYQKKIDAAIAADKTGKGLSDAERARYQAEATESITQANRASAGKIKALNGEMAEVARVAQFKRDTENATTDNAEYNMRLLGMQSKAAADKVVKDETEKLDKMKALNSGFNDTEIRAQQAKVDAATRASSEKERLLAGYGIKSVAVAEAEVRTEKEKLDKIKALNDPAYAAEIAASEEKIRRMELENDASQKTAHAKGLRTLADAKLTMETEDSKLAYMMAHQDQFTAAAIAAQRAIADAAAKAAGETRMHWGDALDSMSKSFGQLGSTVGGGIGSALSSVGGTMGNLKAAQKQADDGGGQFGSLSTMMQAKGAMGKASAAVAAAASIAEGAQKVWAATDARTASQRAMGGAMAGAQAGAAFGPWGMAIGAAAGLVTGLIRGKPEWAKATDEISRDFGAKVSDELGKAIAKDAKEKYGGDRLTATVANIGKIIQESGGITDDNVDKMTSRLRDTFSLVEQGKLSAKEGTKVLDESFGFFADHLLKSGQLASKEFTEIIKLNQTSGLKSAEVVNFVAGQTERLGTSLTALMLPQAKQLADYQLQAGAVIDKLDGLKEGTAEYAAAEAELTRLNEGVHATFEKSGDSMGRFERLAVAGFNSAVAAGVPFIDALGQMGPAFDMIIQQNTILGREGGAAINELLRFREVANANKEVVESAGALNEVMLALSNTGALNTETMADLQSQGKETFDQLTAAGFTETQSLQQMKGYLEQVRNAHEDLGMPIDENTQAMLDQAEANGVLSKKQMSTNEIMMDGLGAIIEAVGGKLPESFKKMAAAGVEAAGHVGKAIGKDATAAVTDLSTKVEELPFPEMATEAELATKHLKTKMDEAKKAVGGVQDELNKTDWGGWAKKGVSAAYEAKDAVDALSYGHSPGGIKDIPILLDESTRAAAEFARKVSMDMLQVKEQVDSINAPDIISQIEQQVAQESQNAAMSEMSAKEQAAQNKANKAAAAAQAKAEKAAAEALASGTGIGVGEFNLTFDIKAYDAQGVQQSVENQILPQILETLRRGRMLTSLRELVR